MLTEQRQECILKQVQEKGSVSVTDLKELLNASESTVRRDITALDQEGKLKKVFGGAMSLEQKVTAHEYTVAQKSGLNMKEKIQIARYAAKLIRPDDCVYLDAGTTTACMLPYIKEKQCTYITNAVAHAQYLVSQGFKVYLIGGELKGTTEAVIGSMAIQMLSYFHFTKGFFGTNGVDSKCGCTTPDVKEAMIKKAAYEQCRNPYILCDHSKFDQISSVTFASFKEALFLTDKRCEGYEACKNVVVVSEQLEEQVV